MKSLQGPPKPLSGEPKNMKKLQSLCPRLCFTVLALAALFVSITGATTFAQTAGAGSINGTVSDAAQAAIPGAVVTVTNTDTGVIHTYTTNSTGLYSAPFLQPGHYKVDATAPNFGKVQIAGGTRFCGLGKFLAGFDEGIQAAGQTGQVARVGAAAADASGDALDVGTAFQGLAEAG